MADSAQPPPPSHRDLARRLQGLNLYLVGMMGAGKSATGRPLAEALGYRFVDADEVISVAAGRSIPEIFADDGEAGFRQLETAVLNQLAHWHSLVVATGGGVVTQPQNWGHLHQGVVVWLDAPETVLLARLRADSTARPLMDSRDPEARLRTLLQERRPLYAQADLRIDQELRPEGPQAVAAQVLTELPTILKARAPAPTHPVSLVDADGRHQPSLN